MMTKAPEKKMNENAKFYFSAKRKISRERKKGSLTAEMFPNVIIMY